ncbi:MAG: translocation/assembly module TamB domain-containing protein [Rikenellaceae bacterium]
MIASATILLLILFPITLSLVLSISSVQRRIANRLTTYASERIGTTVSLGTIDVTLRGGVELTDVLVCDLQGDTMIYASRLRTLANSYSRGEHRLGLGSTVVDGGVVNLRARLNDKGETEMNIKQISNILSPTKSDNPLELFIDDLSVSGVELSIEQLTKRNPEYGVDMRDMRFDDLELKMDNLLINGSLIRCVVEHLKSVEKSGFEINDLSGELYIDEGYIAIANMNFNSRWSYLTANHLMLRNDSWGGYREFNTTTFIDIDVTSGSISSDDLAYFAPSLRSSALEFRDLEFTARGEVCSLDVAIYNLSYGDGTRFCSSFLVEGLPNIEELNVGMVLDEFSSNLDDLDQLKWSFTGSGFSESLFTKIGALGDINLRGWFEGGLSNFDYEAELHCDVGGVSSSGAIDIGEGGVMSLVDCVVDLDAFDMESVLPGRKLGALTMSVSGSGDVDGGRSNLGVNCLVDRIYWRGLPFDGIRIDGEVGGGGLKRLTIESRDSDFDLGLSASASHIFSGSAVEDVVPRYNLDMNINQINLHSLGINLRDQTSVLGGRITLEGEGRSVEECRGGLMVYEGRYRYGDEAEVRSDSIKIDFLSQTGDRFVVLRSDIVDADFVSSSSVSQVIEYIKGALVGYLPALYKDPEGVEQIIADLNRRNRVRVKMDSKFIEEEEEIDEFDKSGLDITGHIQSYLSEQSLSSKLTIGAHHIGSLTEAIVPRLVIGDGSTLDLDFDPSTQSFEMELNLTSIESGQVLATEVEVGAQTRGESISMRGDVRELFIGSTYIDKLNVEASASDNVVSMQSSLLNPTDSSTLNVGLTMGLRNIRGRGLEYNFHLLPSTFERQGDVWDMGARMVRIGVDGIDVEDLRVESRDQLMTINGRASTLARDTLRMDLRNFDLSIFSAFISKLGYHIEGRTSGEALLSSVFDARRIEAQVALDSVSVNTLAAPPMLLVAEWDGGRNQARLHLTDRQSCDTLIRGYYVPTEVRYFADLKVDSLHMAMLDPPMKGVIADTEGTASLAVTLSGTRRAASLNGEVTLHDVSTTVGYTKTRYEMPSGVIKINNNMLNGVSIPVSDGAGGSASMSLDVDLKYLSNIHYDLRVSLRNLMVLNTLERDNDLFYGRVFASGAMSVAGDKSGSRMNIAARTEPNSNFFMPLANKSNISSADFITFVQPSIDESVVMSDRRRELLARINGSAVSGAKSGMEVNMNLDVQSNTELQLVIDPTVGDIIKARGAGNLSMKIDPATNTFDMYGDYTITEGNYLFTLGSIVNKRFVIDPNSTIKWTGTPMDPILDINAIYQLKASLQPLIADESSRAVPVDCIINLSERLTQPDVEFAIQLPTSDPEQQSTLANLLNDQEAVSRQFFYLMLANSFISDSAGSSDLGVNTTASTGFELLTNQLSNWLSSSNYNVIIRYRPESDLAGDEIDIGFSKGLVNNRLLVELEGNYIIDNKQAMSEDASDFMGDVYITWLIDRAGALQLKGFTQTIDRYDENQGLQETGIGLYYRENFENFRDLQQKVRARFQASTDRLERRAERRAARKEEALKKEEEEE